MQNRNRNILILVLALILVCCAVVGGGLAGAAFIARTKTSTSAGRPLVSTTIEVSTVAPMPTRAAPPALVTIPPEATAAESSPAPGISPAPGQGVEATPVATRPGPAVTETSPFASDAAALAAQGDMPARDLRGLAMRLRPGVGDIPSVVNTTPPSYKVGDTLSFWVENSDTQEHREISATLKYITPHVYMWVEKGVTVDQAGLEKSANLFETKTYPTDREFFGSEWTPGVDDDVHLSILHATNLGANIAGYYSSADEYSHLVNRYSNEKEMFYISADPGSSQPGSDFYDGVLAHEFQHMIHWANDRNEESWVNEGMSDLAAHLNGFDVGGVEYAYADRPDTQLDTWSDPSIGNAEHYGASYLFMEYFLGRFGETLTKAVVADKEHGISGFDDALAKAGRPERFNDIFADWLVANYLDQPDASPKGRFGYTDINPPPPAVAETYQRFPVQGTGKSSQYGATYIDLKPSQDLTVDFTGDPTVPLVDARPYGKYAWWSNRGDDSDATLTRSVDLTKVSSATLTFAAWYDVESGYDYVYVEGSTDGGQNWQILPGRQTTDQDKSGNAFGAGWTGTSGGTSTPQWINERVDLTPFAGKQFQLRFEYVTDDAVNGPGFLLDNIAIPQIGFKDDVENGDNGWKAEGWFRTDNVLAEPWLVEVVASGKSGVTVQRMNVGPDGRGQLHLIGAADYDDVRLIVSALAPVTTETASFQYTISTAQIAYGR